MQAIFLLFRDVFESDQQALVLVLESTSFLECITASACNFVLFQCDELSPIPLFELDLGLYSVHLL